MVDNNHPWSSIQNYSLSEIGEFLVAIVKKEARQKSEQLTQLWLSHNLKYKGLQDVIKRIEESLIPRSKEEAEEAIQNAWKRLANIQSRLR